MPSAMVDSSAGDDEPLTLRTGPGAPRAAVGVRVVRQADLDSARLSNDESSNLTPEDLPALLEALLLVAPEPAEPQELAAVAGVPVSAVEEALARMQADSARGLVIVRHRGTAHLASAPRFAAHVRRFLH